MRTDAGGKPDAGICTAGLLRGARRSHTSRKEARIKGGAQVLEGGGKHELRKEVKVNGEAIDQTGAGGGVV